MTLAEAAQLYDGLLAYIAEHSGVSRASAHSVFTLEREFWRVHPEEFEDWVETFGPELFDA